MTPGRAVIITSLNRARMNGREFGGMLFALFNLEVLNHFWTAVKQRVYDDMAHTSSHTAFRVLWADYLKIFAMFAVVLIHSAAPLLVAYEERGAGVWWIGNLYDSAARWCIPAFFMLSGAFLIDKARTLGSVAFLRRRLARIGVPFLAWSAVYYIWNIEINGADMAYESFLVSIIQAPAYYHLWFFYVLIGLYLIAPLLSIYFASATRRNVAYFLILWALFGSLAPTIEAIRGSAIFFIAGSPFSLFRYIGFFALGYVLRDVRCSGRQCVVLLLVFVTGLAITALGTWRLTVSNQGEFNGALYEYYSPNVVVMAASIFCIIKSVPGLSNATQSHCIGKSVALVGACVPGVYLVHALVIAALKQGLIGGVRFEPDYFGTAPGVLLFALVVFVISLTIALGIRAIPVLRRLAP